MTYVSNDPAINAAIKAAEARLQQARERTQRQRDSVKATKPFCVHRASTGRRTPPPPPDLGPLDSRLPAEPANAWRLTEKEAALYRLLSRRGFANIEQLAGALYGDRGPSAQQCTRVMLGRLRSRLEMFSIVVPHRLRGFGIQYQPIYRAKAE